MTYGFRLASPEESNAETTHIPLRFFSLNDPKLKASSPTIGAFVRSKAFTIAVQLSTLEFTTKELGPGVIVFKDIQNRKRVSD
jgi:hypothetical protein